MPVPDSSTLTKMRTDRVIYNDLMTRMRNPTTRSLPNPQIAIKDASIINEAKVGASKNAYRSDYGSITIQTPCCNN
jgi:hypothetical protein